MFLCIEAHSIPGSAMVQARTSSISRRARAQRRRNQAADSSEEHGPASHESRHACSSMGEIGGVTPSFEGLLDSDRPKDTEVVISEEETPISTAQGCAAGAEEEQGDTGSSIALAAHWVVLWSLSSYFRAKLERCSSTRDVVMAPTISSDPNHQQQQQQQPYQYSLKLLVPPGQLELGRRLITAMYSSSPDLSDLEAPQLMQLAALADCYGVGKVVAAASAQLQKLSVATMPLGIAAAVLALPEACLSLEALTEVRKTASNKLQQELGDLEVVWGDKDKQQALLGLPFKALLHLLVDRRTRVASEDTAVYTVGRWLEEHPQTVSQQQRQQLVDVLRLPNCTTTYLATGVAPAASWLREAGLKEAEALGLLTLPTATGTRADRLKWVYQDRPAWKLPARPASSVKEVVVQWQLPLPKLEEVVQGKGSINARPEESLVTWCGRSWGTNVRVQRGYMGMYLLSQREAARYTATFCVQGTPAQLPGVSNAVYCNHSDGHILGNGDTWGCPYILIWGADKAWPQVKALLEYKKLVHPDGCLHLRITVSHVS